MSTTLDRPTVPEGALTFDRTDYAKLWRDTPQKTPDWQGRANLRPGTCVKTKDARVCGKVHTHDVKGCVVIGHGWEDWDSERFVWRGSLGEFLRTWVID
jgi:hypothetical protein